MDLMLAHWYFLMLGSFVQVVSENDQFVGLFFQDKMMHGKYKNFEDLLMIEANWTVPTTVCVDCIGNSEIATIYLTAEENEPSIQKLVEAFKKHNPSWNSTKVIMTWQNTMFFQRNFQMPYIKNFQKGNFSW